MNCRLINSRNVSQFYVAVRPLEVLWGLQGSYKIYRHKYKILIQIKVDQLVLFKPGNDGAYTINIYYDTNITIVHRINNW